MYIVQLNAPELAESKRLERDNTPHLAVYKPENPPQNVNDIVKHQKARRNPYSPYNSEYPNSYEEPPIASDDRKKGIFGRAADYFRRMRQGDKKKPVYNSQDDNLGTKIIQFPSIWDIQDEEGGLEKRLRA